VTIRKSQLTKPYILLLVAKLIVTIIIHTSVRPPKQSTLPLETVRNDGTAQRVTAAVSSFYIICIGYMYKGLASLMI
jgi:hypothetical protein